MKIRSTEFRITGLNGRVMVTAERLGWFEGMSGSDDQWKLQFLVPSGLAGVSDKPYKVWHVEGEAAAKEAAVLIGAEIEEWEAKLSTLQEDFYRAAMEWTIPSEGRILV